MRSIHRLSQAANRPTFAITASTTLLVSCCTVAVTTTSTRTAACSAWPVPTPLLSRARASAAASWNYPDGGVRGGGTPIAITIEYLGLSTYQEESNMDHEYIF